ncbi:MAG TPA: hypothetical protein VK395_35835 [Gemmataceae bacterium]|nr:hypothetical protein [Gemmataceae bacterium]
MRKIILFNVTTLDGFFKGDNGALDWFVIDEETYQNQMGYPIHGL